MKSTIDAPQSPTRLGDPRSLEAERWIEDHHARIYAYLRRRCGGEADAVELTQLTFTRAWAARDRFEQRSSVVSWLHGIAHHVWLDWRRKAGRFEERSDAWWDQVPGDGASPAEALSRTDSAGVVFAAAERLEEGLRDTVHLHYYQGLSLAETGAALGIATSTVKYRLREALAQIQRAVNATHPLPPTSTSTSL